jgi:hypothetical protein
MNFFKSLSPGKVFYAGVLMVLAVSVQAQTFSYNVGDLLIGFRQTAGGTYDLVINAGPVSTFTNLVTGGKIVITSLAGSLLKSAFTTTNGLSWSAFACYDASVPSQKNTLFMSRPRADVNTQSDPWVRASTTSQGTVISKVNGVGTGAYNIGSGLAAGANNTPAALVENESYGVAPTYSYNFMLGTSLRWGTPNGGFQGIPEQNTPDTFTTAGQLVRSDFYWLVPGSGAGTYLGYFDFNTNGVLTYTAGPSASILVPPAIVSIVRTNTTTTVSFTTGSSGTYSLLATNNLAAAHTSWPAVGSVPGNGLTNSISETNASSQRFYLISAQ